MRVFFQVPKVAWGENPLYIILSFKYKKNYVDSYFANAVLYQNAIHFFSEFGFYILFEGFWVKPAEKTFRDLEFLISS